MKKKNILIISMTAGFGHVRAGQALFDYAVKNLPNVTIEHIDVVDIDDSLKNYGKAYDMISRKFSFIWNGMYKYVPVFIAKKTMVFMGSFNKKLKNYIFEKKPDVIIFTNVMTLTMLTIDFHKEFPGIKTAMVVTDYHGHPYYHFSYIDYYFVATQEVKKDLEMMGVESQKIKITGIPIHPKFYIKENVNNLKAKYGIKNNFPVALLIASFKISKKDLLLVVTQLLNLNPDINVIFIANRNQVFYDMIKNAFPGNSRLKVVDWTLAMEEYMKMSDVVISKAGGLTVSECMSLQKPLIMVSPIPGQEEYNADFVEKNDLGVKVNSAREIINVLPDLIARSRVRSMSFISPDNPCQKIFQYLTYRHHIR